VAAPSAVAAVTTVAPPAPGGGVYGPQLSPAAPLPIAQAQSLAQAQPVGQAQAVGQAQPAAPAAA
jgi:hypothetical protein